MRFSFTLYVQKHANGAHTVSLVEAPDVAAHGVSLEHCKEQVRRAMRKRIQEAAPGDLSRLPSARSYRSRILDTEVPTSDARNRARKANVPMKVLALLAEHEGSLIVLLPKLSLTFLLRDEEQLADAVRDEVRAFFHGADSDRVLAHAFARREEIEGFDVDAEPRSAEERDAEQEKRQTWALAQAGENLNERHRRRGSPLVHGMDPPLALLTAALSAETRRSVLLVGPPGAGKSALVEELARRIARNECGEPLRKRALWRLNAQRIEALPIWWEGAMQDIVEECRRENHILHVTAVTDLLEGSTSFTRGGEMSRFLKDFIASGAVVLIGEATPEILAAHASSGGGFLSLFETIRVEEPAPAQLQSILLGVRRDLETEHRLRIQPEAVDYAVELTRRFLPYVAFPGKVVGMLRRVSERHAQAQVGRSEIAREFSLHSGLPINLLDDAVKLDLPGVRSFFEERLVGQPDALEAVVDLVSVLKAGLNDPHKPLGTLLLIGPTGTGKTFLAKCLAEYLFGSAERLARVDMSEFAGPDAAMRLIGPPGRPERGALTSRILQQPFSVVLLDELEKADSEIFDVLLQLLGEGRLADGAGTAVDFRNCVILMTSNLGARRSGTSSLGFQEETGDAAARYRSQVEDFFRPEFVNRIDKILVFNPLGREAMEKIVRRELELLLSREGLSRRRSLVELDEPVVAFLAEKGFDPDYGARPLKRAIERYVAVPLARFLASTVESETLSLRVLRDGDATKVQAQPIREAKARVRTSLPGLSEIVPGGSRRRSVAELQRETGDIRRKLREWHQSDTAAGLRRRLRMILDESSKKKFRERPGDEVRRDMRRVYHLERVLKRLDQLLSESEFLEEMIELLRRERDGSLLPQVCQRYEELQVAAGILDIELAVSSEEGNDDAILVFQRFGGETSEGASAGWLRAVATMYARWLHRKGFTYEFAEIRLPRERGEEAPSFVPLGSDRLQDVAQAISASRQPSRIVCFAEGANVTGFLRGEEGLHRLRGKLHESDMGGGGTRLVRVHVAPYDGRLTPDQWWTGTRERAARERSDRDVSWEFALQSEDERRIDVIVRTFQLSGDVRRVEDPRTGLEVPSVLDVLEGDLDPFILAFLRSEMEDRREDREK